VRDRMKLLVIGGTHFVGRHAVERAVERGHEVTVFHRGGSEPGEGFPDVEHVHGDRDGGLSALKRRTWDATLDTCGYVPRVVRESARLPGIAAGHYTFVSSLSVYPDGVDQGATEATPGHGPPFPDTEEITGESYGPLKIACELEVQGAFPGRALIVRPGFIVGPYDPIDRFPYWVRRAAMGGEMLAPEPADLRVQLVDVRDLAAFVVDHAEAGTGDVFNVTGPKGVLTMRELLEACVAAGDADTETIWVGQAFLRERGLHEGGEHGWEQLPYWYPKVGGSPRSTCQRRSARGSGPAPSPRRSPTRSPGTARADRPGRWAPASRPKPNARFSMRGANAGDHATAADAGAKVQVDLCEFRGDVARVRPGQSQSLVHPTGQYSKKCPQVEGHVLRLSGRHAKVRREGYRKDGSE
jgi:2'-hydroxyisoflavone reductase